jgi:hypothetical protein
MNKLPLYFDDGSVITHSTARRNLVFFYGESINFICYGYLFLRFACGILERFFFIYG